MELKLLKKMDDKKLIIILLLIIVGFLLFFAYNYVGNKFYQRGYSDGMTALAIEQYQKSIVVMSNGTAIQTINIGDICK